PSTRPIAIAAVARTIASGSWSAFSNTGSIMLRAPAIAVRKPASGSSPVIGALASVRRLGSRNSLLLYSHHNHHVSSSVVVSVIGWGGAPCSGAVPPPGAPLDPPPVLGPSFGVGVEGPDAGLPPPRVVPPVGVVSPGPR